MILHNLKLTNFKAYTTAKVTFGKNVIVVYGPNGAGKTNLLDAIHYLCIGKSYFNPQDQQNVRHGERFLRLEGELEAEKEKLRNIVCICEPGKRKRIEVNNAPVGRLRDHFGKYPVVVIAPDDVDLVNRSSDGRRRFLDFTIAFENHDYIELLDAYNRLLQQRNRLLKDMARQGKWNEDLLEVYDAKLEPLAAGIHHQRSRFVADFLPIFRQMHQSIATPEEQCDLRLDSSLATRNFRNLMRDNREVDRSLQRTSAGAHRDDLELLLNGLAIKKFGSQGQKKSMLIALKLAQYQFLEQHTGRKPLLLLDDLFDKLDNNRVAHLLGLLDEGRFGQVFVTDTDGERVTKLLSELPQEFDSFEIRNGAIRK